MRLWMKKFFFVLVFLFTEEVKKTDKGVLKKRFSPFFLQVRLMKKRGMNSFFVLRSGPVFFVPLFFCFSLFSTACRT